MASLAVLSALQGHAVSGSDDHSDPVFAQELTRHGIRCFDMFAQATINAQDQVVVGRFVDERNTEYITAKTKNIPIVGEVDYLARCIDGHPLQAILGNYESGIISAWLLHVYRSSGWPMSGLTTSVTNGMEMAVPWSEATHRVCVPFQGLKRDWHTYESDFLHFTPNVVIVPSIVYDFPDLAMTLDDVYQSYFTFVKRVPRNGLIIGNCDWSRMKRMRVHLADRTIEAYGFDRDAAWQIVDYSADAHSSTFSIKHENQRIGPFTIPFPGRQAVSWATAVVVSALLDKIPVREVGEAIKNLPAMNRFFSTRTDPSGRLFIDDCADNPATIEDVISLARELYPGRNIWCLYQSGSYLRSKALQDDFEAVLSQADSVYFADIAGLPKEKSEGIHARHLVSRMRSRHPQTFYIESVEDTAKLLRERIPSTDCVITLGAYGACQAITETFFTAGE